MRFIYPASGTLRVSKLPSRVRIRGPLRPFGVELAWVRLAGLGLEKLVGLRRCDNLKVNIEAMNIGLSNAEIGFYLKM